MPMPTDYEIYQTYLKGPGAVIRLFEQALGTVAIYGPPPPDDLTRTIAWQNQELDRLQARIARLETELGKLRHLNFQLQRRNLEVEGRLVKDSHNSSRPPSSDPVPLKRTRSLRRPSGRKPGGQPGHPGHTRMLTPQPDRAVVHRPACCRQCQAPLATGFVIQHERRQVLELPPLRLKVTEHRAEARRCLACGCVTKGTFPDGVHAAVQYGPRLKAAALYFVEYQLLPYARTGEVLRDLFGCQVSLGTLVNGVRACAAELIETELKIKQKLRHATVLHADETGLRVNKRLAYVHVASTAQLTHYGHDAHRGKEAIERIDILPGYRGTSVHDGWAAYEHFTLCDHSLCCAHLLRELTYFEEVGAGYEGWAKPLRELLLEIKVAVECVRVEGAARLPAAARITFTRRYDELIEQGLELVPPPSARGAPGAAEMEAQVTTPTALMRKQARNLLLRMQRRRVEVLRFMTDFAVPFDNNQAERDLRMVKLQQKIGGCFRTEAGATDFCRIRSYLSTMRKQGKGVLTALHGACRGAPLSLRKRAG
jgi:transposase